METTESVPHQLVAVPGYHTIKHTFIFNIYKGDVVRITFN